MGLKSIKYTGADPGEGMQVKQQRQQYAIIFVTKNDRH